MNCCSKQNNVFGKASLLTLIFILIVTVSYLFMIGTVDLRSYIVPFHQSKPSKKYTAWVPHCRNSPPLKVYMYDLPRRFNVGMLDSGRSSVKTPLTAETLPSWPTRSGLVKQNSVEYWMMASLLYNSNVTNKNNMYYETPAPAHTEPPQGQIEKKMEVNKNESMKMTYYWKPTPVHTERGNRMEAVRVEDPEIADVFFVPFFSSISYTFYGTHRRKNDTAPDPDKQLQVDMLKFLKESKYWRRSRGRDHVIPMHHPDAFRHLRKKVNASILIVADFGRYPKSMSNLRKDVVAPYFHNVDSYTDDEIKDPFESRSTLLFFRGGVVRKEKGVVRAKLSKILAGYDDVHYENSGYSEDNLNLSAQGMRASKFCLSPAGDTPSSCRLFDAIVSHCVPVIVSDKIELPFEDELDYSKFSIFFSTEEALKPGYMVDQLRKVSKERWLNMWKKLKSISPHYEYQYPPKREDAVNMLWRQIKHKLPASTLSEHRTRRLKIPDWW